MFIYNITIKISWQIQPEWLQWMQEIYVEEVMNTGCFVKYQMVRLLEIEEDEGPTYALQLYADSSVNYDRYVHEYLPGNERAVYTKWGNNVLFFCTLMEVIS